MRTLPKHICFINRPGDEACEIWLGHGARHARAEEITIGATFHDGGWQTRIARNIGLLQSISWHEWPDIPAPRGVADR
jgi:hypothetical protein